MYWFEKLVLDCSKGVTWYERLGRLVMNKPTVIVLISQSFNDYVVKKIDVRRLLHEGFSVEIFDLSGFMMPDHPVVNRKFDDDRLTVSQFGSRSAFVAGLARLPEGTVAIDHSNPDPWVRAELNRKNIKIIRLLTGGLPVSGPRSAYNKATLSETFSRPWSILRRGGILALLSRLSDHLLKNLFIKLKKPYLDLVILGGKRLLANEAPYLKDDTRVVESHVHDVDTYKAATGKPAPTVEGDYLVFIDQNIPYHPDFNLLKVKYSDPANYYLLLRNFFELLEITGFRVVVSLHPRDDGRSIKERFGGRQVFQGMTPELVAASNGVITHFSNAINFAVMGGKPIIFVADKEMLDLCFQIKILVEWLEQPLIMIDRSVELQDIEAALRSKPKAWERYRSNFLQCDNDANSTITDVLVEELHSICCPVTTIIP